MAFSVPYGQHNYMGEFANDGAAESFIQNERFDSLQNGTGTPQLGMWYFNTTSNLFRYWSGAWTTLSYDSAVITQTAHGFTLPSFGVLPLVYDNTAGEYRRAQADVLTNAADLVAIGFPTADTILLFERGYIPVTHGLPVGEWFIVDPSLAGNVVSQSTVVLGVDLIQRVFFTVDANTIRVDLQPMQVPV